MAHCNIMFPQCVLVIPFDRKEIEQVGNVNICDGFASPSDSNTYLEIRITIGVINIKIIVILFRNTNLVILNLLNLKYSEKQMVPLLVTALFHWTEWKK